MTKWLQFLKLFSEKNQHLTQTEVLQKAKISFVKLKDYYEQYGGGDCSLCGSPGTNKSTCPRNPDAKNPNPAKHPNAQEAAPVVVRASSVKAPAAVPVVVRASSVKAPAAVPIVVRANSVNAPAAVPLPMKHRLSLLQLVQKVDQLGKSGKNLQSLTKEEIDQIIDNALSEEQSKNISHILYQEVPKFMHTPKWSCSGLRKDIEKDNELSFYAQVLAKIQCIYSAVQANSAKPVVVQKGKTALCVEQSTKKYTDVKRTSPSYPANECCGEIMKGKDARMYESRADKNGICKWYALK